MEMKNPILTISKYLPHVVDYIIFGISVLITPVEPLEPRFWDNSEICKYLFVNNNKYLSYFVDIIIFGISEPDYLSRTIQSKSLRLFRNFSIFCLSSYKQQINLHMTNSKRRNSDSA